ncbi:MAG TPA: hypothetical protein DCQ98_11570 [Planctomycetaceae bacterium]|nr:hypothetical protein [Planctomycetaceae bacterium]
MRGGLRRRLGRTTARGAADDEGHRGIGDAPAGFALLGRQRGASRWDDGFGCRRSLRSTAGPVPVVGTA